MAQRRRTRAKKDDEPRDTLGGIDADLDEDRQPPAPEPPTAEAPPNPTQDGEFKPISETQPASEKRVEYGTAFAQYCEPCSIKRKENVRCIQVRTNGPVASYKCPICGVTTTVSRPWRETWDYSVNSSQNHAAARKDMMDSEG